MIFSQLPHMRTSISPVPRLVYIPLIMSICMRTFAHPCSLARANRYNTVLSPTWKGLWKCANVPRISPNFQACADGDHLFLGLFRSQWIVQYARKYLRTRDHRVRANRYNRVLSPTWKRLWKCANVPRISPNFQACADGDHLFLGLFTSQWIVQYARKHLRTRDHRVRANRYNRVLSPTWKGLWKCADVPRISPNFQSCADGDHLFLG